MDSPTGNANYTVASPHNRGNYFAGAERGTAACAPPGDEDYEDHENYEPNCEQRNTKSVQRDTRAPNSWCYTTPNSKLGEVRNTPTSRRAVMELGVPGQHAPNPLRSTTPSKLAVLHTPTPRRLGRETGVSQSKKESGVREEGESQNILRVGEKGVLPKDSIEYEECLKSLENIQGKALLGEVEVPESVYKQNISNMLKAARKHPRRSAILSGLDGLGFSSEGACDHLVAIAEESGKVAKRKSRRLASLRAEVAKLLEYQLKPCGEIEREIKEVERLKAELERREQSLHQMRSDREKRQETLNQKYKEQAEAACAQFVATQLSKYAISLQGQHQDGNCDLFHLLSDCTLREAAKILEIPKTAEGLERCTKKELREILHAADKTGLARNPNFQDLWVPRGEESDKEWSMKYGTAAKIRLDDGSKEELACRISDYFQLLCCSSCSNCTLLQAAEILEIPTTTEGLEKCSRRQLLKFLRAANDACLVSNPRFRALWEKEGWNLKHGEQPRIHLSTDLKPVLTRRIMDYFQIGHNEDQLL